MQIKPILSAMRHHKAGVGLIALQIALTLAIVCNALFIIQQRLAHLSEPTGLDEANVFVISNQWANQSTEQQTHAQILADMAALRRLPSVRDVSPSNSYPLRGSGWDDYITLTPEQTEKTTDANVYLGDEHLLDTLGVTLLAGRNFRADEVGQISSRQNVASPVVIVTKALADRLYPDGSALGKSFYEMSKTPSTIIGIIDLLQNQSVSTWNTAYAYQSVIRPLQEDNSDGLYYIVRARPGQLVAAMREVPKALYTQNLMRIIDPEDGELSFAEARARAYDSDRGMAILMGIISVVLLAITAAGIVGLTSFWVGQRRKQIGVRRALGATRSDILRYFLTENLLISVGGVVVGIALAIGINLWMVTQFEIARLSLVYVLIGVVVLLLLGQIAVLAPARRASNVSPIEATRST
ncbi:FtsX-like permease family protein [Rhodanobacter sp. MP1X3]|uniref:ABC transporter permease n=1 Tax=Rhodanobacter sp. MP1X3 TaxID=2723086 RepID=UPI00160C3A4F|nr:FtsX-like permease family protein [Rhodanobacter sp. MP1X3]MBB6244884.1 putative ABC transport system permease protein [Rhodanobacter sp. MP1X3]